jgi:predicted RNase H-like HicB family nuclease
MKISSGQYSFRVILEPDEDGYHVYVPSLAGCHSWGKTLDEAKINIREAIKSHVASLVKDKMLVPKDVGLETFEVFSSADFKLTPA